MKDGNKRREFIKSIGVGVGAFIALPVMGGFLNSCEREEGAIKPDTFELNVSLDDYPELKSIGGSEIITENNKGIFINAVRKDDDTILTYDRTCPHQGCFVGLPENLNSNMKCPCHGAEYDINDGSVRQKPNDGSNISGLTALNNNFDKNKNSFVIFI